MASAVALLVGTLLAPACGGKAIIDEQTTTSVSGTSSTGTATDECMAAEDCPQPESVCLTAVCVAGECGTAALPSGTPAPNQDDGDCRMLVCRGDGTLDSVNDDSDVPPDEGDCLSSVCHQGVLSYLPAPTGTPCDNAGYCDGAGNCLIVD
jgi:hypothetical protein